MVNSVPSQLIVLYFEISRRLASLWKTSQMPRFASYSYGLTT